MYQIFKHLKLFLFLIHDCIQYIEKNEERLKFHSLSLMYTMLKHITKQTNKKIQLHRNEYNNISKTDKTKSDKLSEFNLARTLALYLKNDIHVY